VANKNKRVLIAGGGIGGITALLALRQRGIAAELFEQAHAPSGADFIATRV
jgi:salicylate hydroxylase